MMHFLFQLEKMSVVKVPSLETAIHVTGKEDFFGRKTSLVGRLLW